jgi:hypothetical protein
MQKRHYTKPCQFKGCYANAKAHGLCTGHLDQRARGKELTPLKPRRDVCDFPGCGRKHFAFGLLPCPSGADAEGPARSHRPGSAQQGRWFISQYSEVPEWTSLLEQSPRARNGRPQPS